MTRPPQLLGPIAIITAGAGGMICGSCLNDNTLAKALVEMGIDAQLIPTYTPIRTDERDVSIDRVFFGGINVYLEQILPLWGRLPRFLRHWLNRPGFIRWATSGRIKTDAKRLGPLTVSMLRGEAGRQRADVDELATWLSRELKPSLVQLSNMLIAGFVPALKRVHAAPVLVSLQGDDIFLDGLLPRYREQAIAEMRRLDAAIDGYVVHSSYYGQYMADYLQLPADKFHRVPLGIAVDDFAPPLAASGPTESSPVTIGYLARLAPEKGLDQLCEAFCQLKRQPATANVRLKIAGWMGVDHEEYAKKSLQRVRDAGHAESLEYVGEVDRNEKRQFLHSLDILCVPSPYREPKGLYVLEALASGIPVVQPDHGAFPELLASTGGGLLFNPGRLDSLVDRLSELASSPERRQQLAAEGLSGVRRHHSSATMAARAAAVYEKLVGAKLS